MTLIALVFQEVGDGIRMGIVSDTLVTKKRVGTERPYRLTSLAFKFPRRESSNYEDVDYVSKVHLFSEDFCVAWSGSLLSAKALVRTSYELLKSDQVFADVPDFCERVVDLLDDEHLESLSFIFMGVNENLFGFQSKNCHSFDSGDGRRVVLAGTGANFLELHDYYFEDVRSFERLHEGHDHDFAWFNRTLGNIGCQIYLAEGRIPDFSEYATGGWVEFTLASASGVQKIPSCTAIVNNLSQNGDIDLYNFSKIYYNGNQPILVSWPYMGDGSEELDPQKCEVVTIQPISFKNSDLEILDSFSLPMPEFFVGSGFRNWTRDIGVFVFVCSDGEFCGLELMRKNPIDIERKLRSPGTVGLVSESYSPELVNSMDANLVRFREERAAAKGKTAT